MYNRPKHLSILHIGEHLGYGVKFKGYILKFAYRSGGSEERDLRLLWEDAYTRMYIHVYVCISRKIINRYRREIRERISKS